jgi:C4-dicarboxylate-specific signal transduction histidine kinase
MMQDIRLPKYPKRIMLSLVLVFFALLGSNLYLRSEGRRTFHSANAKLDHLIKLKEEVNQFQQDQELAIRMGAFSGRLSWENSYYRGRRKFYQRVEEIRALLNIPALQSQAAETDLNNFDRKIFRLINLGRKTEAISLTQSLEREYLTNSRLRYLNGLSKAISQYDGRQGEMTRKNSRMLDILNWAIVVISCLLTIAMIWIFNDWARKVQRINAGLDSLVREKIKELDRERMKMVESSKMATLGEMAGGIAHEINNPLTIIKLAASQIGAQAETASPDMSLLKEHSSILLKTIDRIAKIVQGLRMFSRDGSHDPFQRVPVAELIDEALSLCRERLRSQGIELRQEGVDENLSIDCRETQICQVLLNLLNNAADAVENQPDRWVDISAKARGKWLELAVTDSGPSIPAEVKEKLFQPFFSTKEIGKGTGIGLSISLGIVKSHSGELYLDNASPHTRFVICLPRRQSSSGLLPRGVPA